MSIKRSTLVIICVSCLLTGIMGSGIFFIRFYRTKCAEVTDLQRATKELQQRFERETEQFRRECESLDANITSAKRIVESMGSQLDTDAGNIDSTINEIRRLRETMEQLKDWYSNLGGSTSLYGDNNRSVD